MHTDPLLPVVQELVAELPAFAQPSRCPSAGCAGQAEMPADETTGPSDDLRNSPATDCDSEEDTCPPANAQEPSLEMQPLQAAPAATPRVMLVHMLLPAMLS